MRLRSEKGFTGIDIAVSVVIVFIFVSIISMLIYQVESNSKQISLRTDATYIAINEIEQVKINGFETYKGKSKVNGNNIIIKDEAVSGTQGYYKTIEVEDINDIDNGKTADIVKRVTVKISYMFQGKVQEVELSTILSKEN